MDLSMSGGDHADQDHLRHPLGKTLPIRKGERRTPRTAEDQPAVDREVFAEPLDISNQMVSRVGRKIHRTVARVRNTSAASPLVEQHDPVRGRIEKSAHARRASRARAAVEDQCRLPLGVATYLPMIRLRSPTSSMPWSNGSIVGYMVTSRTSFGPPHIALLCGSCPRRHPHGERPPAPGIAAG